MLTGLWQADGFREHEWIRELFNEHIDKHIYDGRHEMVLDDCILFDKFIHTRPVRYYEQFQQRKNVFLFHLSDEQYHGGYHIYQFFNGVFRNYWSNIFKEPVMILPLGYSNGVSNKILPKPASTRRYSWSFAGETTRASRPEMVAALKSSGTYICHSTDAGNSPPLAPSAYQNILRETVFAPSPMGRLNLECFRLYEALENGCIPIIEERPSLNYFTGLLGPHPLISVQRWTQAQRVITDYSAEPARLDALQSQIFSWWQSEKHSFKHRISDVLNDQSLVRKVTEPPLKPAYSTPFWQLRELYRHQSARGIIRRVKIQLLRAASGRSQKQLIRAD